MSTIKGSLIVVFVFLNENGEGLNFLSGLMQCKMEPATREQRSGTMDLHNHKFTGFWERLWASQEIELGVCTSVDLNLDFEWHGVYFHLQPSGLH